MHKVWLVMGMAAILTGCCPARAEGDLWLTDFEQAKTIAAAKRLPILVDFTGSDWCGWCIRLEKEVFSTPAFQTFAQANLVLVKLDFPRKKPLPPEAAATNEALRKKFGVRGFPTIVLTDADGQEIARTGYRPGGPDAYVAHLRELVKP